MGDNKPPVYKDKIGVLDLAVWEQTGKTKDGKEVSFLTVDLQRSYKKEDEWKKTHALRVNDLPDAQLLLADAYRFAKKEWKKDKPAEE